MASTSNISIITTSATNNHQTTTTHHPNHPAHSFKHQASFLLLFKHKVSILFTSYAEFVFDSWSCWFLFIILIVLVIDYAVFMVLRIILLMDYVRVKLDEARVRVSSWSCKLLVQVLFSDCFILVFAYFLIYWSLLWCLCCLEKMGVNSSWPKVRVLSKMHDLDQLMSNLRCVCICG